MLILFRSKWLWVAGAAILGAIITLTFIWQAGFITHERYLAVYLQTGDIYFGKQVGFWGFKLQDAWTFERGQDGGTTLIPLSAAPWHPKEPININEKQVVFWTYLDPEGQVAQAITGKLTAPPPQVQPPPAGFVPPTASSAPTKTGR